MKKLTMLALGLFMFLLVPTVWASSEFKASLAKLPVYAENRDKGVLVDLVKAIEKVSNNKINIRVMPFSSSVYMAQRGKTDFHMPLIKNDIIAYDKLPFIYSTQTIFKVNFVLYSKKDSNITLDNLMSKKVETDRAHVAYFPFKVVASNSIERSLKKVESGEIDGFIFADFATDPYLRKLASKNIKRTLYKVFESKMILPKNSRGEQTDEMLTLAIDKLRENGELKRIMSSVDKELEIVASTSCLGILKDNYGVNLSSPSKTN